MKRVIEVTGWLERETTKQVFSELRKLLLTITKSEKLNVDIRRFMRRYGRKPKG